MYVKYLEAMFPLNKAIIIYEMYSDLTRHILWSNSPLTPFQRRTHTERVCSVWYVCAHVCNSVFAFEYLNVNLCIYVWICVFMCESVYLCANLCVYVRICVFMCESMYLFVGESAHNWDSFYIKPVQFFWKWLEGTRNFTRSKKKISYNS